MRLSGIKDLWCCSTTDPAGRLVTATNPESGTINYRFDDAGNLVQRTDARGVTTCSGSQSGTSCTDPLAAYDGLNRPVKKTYSDGTPAVTYTYDDAPTNGKGRLRSVSVAGGTSVSYSYDVMGRITASSQTTDGVTYPFTYTYNLAGGVETRLVTAFAAPAVTTADTIVPTTFPTAFGSPESAAPVVSTTASLTAIAVSTGWATAFATPLTVCTGFVTAWTIGRYVVSATPDPNSLQQFRSRPQ